MYFPRGVLPLHAARDVVVAQLNDALPGEPEGVLALALRGGDLQAQGICQRSGRLLPIPPEAWRRPFVRQEVRRSTWLQPGGARDWTRGGGAAPQFDPFEEALQGRSIPVGSDWFVVGIAKADLDQMLADENQDAEADAEPADPSAVAWMAKNVTRRGAWKRDGAIIACRDATHCTDAAARAAWNSLPPEVKGARGRPKKSGG